MSDAREYGIKRTKSEAITAIQWRESQLNRKDSMTVEALTEVELQID